MKSKNKKIRFSNEYAKNLLVKIEKESLSLDDLETNFGPDIIQKLRIYLMNEFLRGHSENFALLKTLNRKFFDTVYCKNKTDQPAITDQQTEQQENNSCEENCYYQENFEPQENFYTQVYTQEQ